MQRQLVMRCETGGERLLEGHLLCAPRLHHEFAAPTSASALAHSGHNDSAHTAVASTCAQHVRTTRALHVRCTCSTHRDTACRLRPGVHDTLVLARETEPR
eukprot:2870962-Rhodomonas_salina.2